MFKLLRRKNSEKTDPRSSYKITYCGEIVSLLQQAYNGRTIFSAHFKDDSGLYSSALLGVYAEHGFIVLDELTPKEGHEKLLKNKSVQLSGKVEGVILSFVTNLIEAREKSGIPFYKLSIPEFVLYKQQRREHRVSTGGHMIPFRGYEEPGTSKPLRGYVADISQNGIGLVVEGATSPIYRQEVLPACTVTLPDEQDAMFSLEVRFVQENKTRKVTRVGGLFNTIDEGTLRKIVRTKNKLEREQCRRVRKD